MKKLIAFALTTLGGFLIAQGIRHHRSAIEDFTKRGNQTYGGDPFGPDSSRNKRSPALPDGTDANFATNRSSDVSPDYEVIHEDPDPHLIQWLPHDNET